MVRLKNAHSMVFGLKGTGKSNWVQYVLRRHRQQYDSHLLYDLCREHGEHGLNRYLPEHRKGDEAVAELDHVLDRMVTGAPRDRRPELVVVEEVSRTAPNGAAPPESLYDLMDLNRHYGVGLMGVARRPAQVHTDLVELANNLFIFKLTGKNDYRRLEEEVQGLGDAVRGLDEYQYVHVNGSREYRTMQPVAEMDTTGEL